MTRNWLFLFFLFSFILINIYLDQRSKQKFKEKHFPKEIIFPNDESIELPKVEEGTTIPKKIYRCYSTLEDMKPFQKVFDLTSERMPDYEQIYYTDDMIDEFIRNNFSDRIYSAYKHINPEYGAARADFFRYLVIYFYGGFYMDIKSGPTANIKGDEFEPKLHVSKGVSGIPHFPKHHLRDIFKLEDDWSFVTNVWFGSEYQQYFILSNKGNLVLKRVIQQVVSNIEHGIKKKEVYSNGNISVVAMSGPIAYSLVIGDEQNIVHHYPGLDWRIAHSLVDYKKIMKDRHYSKIKNKSILI